MLRVFRSIRQSLLQQGKVSRYIGYAIGEILLIMVGIFLALQLNNWNEDRKDRIEERMLLTRVKTEVDIGLNNIEDLLLPNVRMMQDALLEVAAVYKGKPLGDSFEFLKQVAAGASIGWDQPELPQIVYAELVSTGKMGLIERIELRDQIASYYNLIYHFQKTSSLRVNDYAKVAYSLVPRTDLSDGHRRDMDVNDSLSEAEYDALAQAVLSSELNQLVPAALNRSYRLENGWIKLGEEAQVLLLEIESELNKN